MKLPKKDFQSLLRRRGELISTRHDSNEIKQLLASQDYLFSRLSSSTTSECLENIIKYESVHEIKNLQDLHTRISHGRRIYGLFHPEWKEEPLVFTEIALMNNIARSMEEIFQNSKEKPKVLVFYSINATQIGLSGIDLAKNLILKVSQTISQEFNIDKICTLSPIVGFIDWLKAKESSPFNLQKEKLLFYSKDYILHAKKGKHALDPVTNFHCRNGAEFYQVNWNADLNKERSLGMMVNYVYPRNLKKLEENALKYIETGEITFR